MPPPNAPDSWDSPLWRVQRLEEDYAKLSAKIDGVSAALGAGLAAIGTQIAALQVSMPDHYLPRREADASKEAMEARIAAVRDDLGGRIKALEATQSKALWLVLGTLLTTLMNVGLLAFKSLTGHP